MNRSVRSAGKTEIGARVIGRHEMRDYFSVELWYVVGIGGVYYGTKMQAEEAARKAFPDEGADKRYARIYYKTFYQEV